MAHRRGPPAGHRRIRGGRVLSRRQVPYGHQRIDERDIDAVAEVLESDWLTTGPEVAAFEKDLADYCGADFAVVVSSGTAALYGACAALGLSYGTEGVVPSLTFAATATCLLSSGARPVFADVDPTTGNIDPASVETAIGPDTRVIIPVHFAGLPADMEAMARIAERRHVAVIEDAAHALGAIYKGDKVGACTHSVMTVFSFHPVKAITTGEGGAVLTNDEHLATRVRSWRNHGIQHYPAQGGWYYEIETLGANARLTDIACALGRSQLRTLDDRIAERKGIALAYDRLLKPLEDRLILPAHAPDEVRHAWHLYVIRLRDPSLRARIYEDMRAAGIGVQVHYIPAHWHPVFKAFGAPEKGSLPNAEAFYGAALSLPIYAGLEYDDQVRVVSVLRNSLEAARKAGT